MNHRVAAIVLAAGGSRRIGAPKQLLRIDGESLVRRAARTALASCCNAVFVVVGAHSDAILADLEGLAFTRVDNPSWREGIASSIRAAIAVVARNDSVDAALLMLADQPSVTSALLDRLVSELNLRHGELVACAYGETVGAPALFARRYFPELQRLRGDRGAKSVLLGHADAVVRVPFPAAAVDVDTLADYHRLTRRRRPAGGRA